MNIEQQNGANFSPEELREIIKSKRREKVIQLLEQNIFSHDKEEFYTSFRLSEHPRMLTQYTQAELSQIDTFKVPGFFIGFALKHINEVTEIISVHNNEPTILNIGSFILSAAIRNGGNALDHFGTEKLNQLYESMGFLEIYTEPYNPDYDKDGMLLERYGAVPVIYRVLKK